MRIWHAALTLLLVVALLTGCTPCGGVDLGPLLRRIEAKGITPSDTIITDERDVSGFTGVDMRTFGRVVLTQGDSESVTLTGSDNVVALVKTSVQDGILIIETEQPINVLNADKENVLTCDITVKDLKALTVSGAAEVEMDSLTTTALLAKMAGAGQIRLSQLAADSIDIQVSGVGNIEVAGEAARATITISGAGNVDAPDLQCQTAEVTISGLGNATVWVTEKLTGDIKGGGSVSYYGDPQTDTKTSGLGGFKALGAK
jgi:Putative auto-transporter adhesin, head GIN domain